MNKNSNMKATSLKANQAKSTKPNLPNQVYETEQKIPKQTKANHHIYFVSQIGKFKTSKSIKVNKDLIKAEQV